MCDSPDARGGRGWNVDFDARSDRVRFDVSSEYETTNSPSPRANAGRAAAEHSKPPTLHHDSCAQHERRPSLARHHATVDEHALENGFAIPDRGRSQSPVREIALKEAALSSESARATRAGTLVRYPYPQDILEYPNVKHPRIKLHLQLHSPLFIGGSSLEGHLNVVVDNSDCLKHRAALALSTLSIDLVGFEEAWSCRREIFLALYTELIDAENAPPRAMTTSAAESRQQSSWPLRSTCAALPFSMSLPLDTGPPPFRSKNASIRFVLCASAVVRDQERLVRVRTSHDVQVLPTYDPEKALASLRHPLLASDSVVIAHSMQLETVKVTAGIHRLVWVSGGSIFVDVHVANKSRKAVKRLTMSIERDILYYKHAPATTLETLVDQPRVYENNERSIISELQCKARSSGWQAVEAHSADTRTFELEIPRGHATVKCGKHFEVRYFVNVSASVSGSKCVAVQLPITLVHMNSLDVVPNSVAQVAAAIEERRTQDRPVSPDSRARAPERVSPMRVRSRSSPAATTALREQPLWSQGRAFAAPRDQSLEIQRQQRAAMEEVCHALDTSPRKAAASRPRRAHAIRKLTSLHALRGAAADEKAPVVSLNNFSVTADPSPVQPVPPLPDFPHHERSIRSTSAARNKVEVPPRRKGSHEQWRIKAGLTRSRPDERENIVPPLAVPPGSRLYANAFAHSQAEQFAHKTPNVLQPASRHGNLLSNAAIVDNGKPLGRVAQPVASGVPQAASDHRAPENKLSTPDTPDRCLGHRGMKWFGGIRRGRRDKEQERWGNEMAHQAAMERSGWI